jgi:hypothetical protein
MIRNEIEGFLDEARIFEGPNGMTEQNRGLTGQQIRALEMLAGCPDGCSEAVLKANGFTIGLLGKLIRAGLATATPGIVEAGDARRGETGDHGEGADNDRPMTLWIGWLRPVDAGGRCEP